MGTRRQTHTARGAGVPPLPAPALATAPDGTARTGVVEQFLGTAVSGAAGAGARSVVGAPPRSAGCPRPVRAARPAFRRARRRAGVGRPALRPSVRRPA